MKSLNKTIFGLALIALGILWILSISGVLSFNIFFRGWWTLLIMIPFLLGFITHPNWGSVMGFSTGVLLLLQAQGLIDWSIFWKLGLAVLLIIIGACSIFSGKSHGFKMETTQIDNGVKSYNIAFGEQNKKISGEGFEGARIEAAFGSMTLDLREAIINNDQHISVQAKFAGVKIMLPDGIAVDVKGTSAFGGVNNKLSGRSGRHTIFLAAECAFGGVEIS